MPSFSTVFRAAVMFAAAILFVKGWQAYGPSAEGLKSIASRAFDAAATRWSESKTPAEKSSGLVIDAQLGTAPLAPRFVEPAPVGADITEQKPNVRSTWDNSVEPAAFSEAVSSEHDAIIDHQNHVIVGSPNADRLPALLSRLETLGAVDPQLTTWGTSGQLFRFSCRANMADSPTYSRHFESVAPAPLRAVEDVVAKVEAWRIAQHERQSVP